MKTVIVLLILSSLMLIEAQRCQTTCTRQARFTVDIDGVRTTAGCSDGNQLQARCPGCCDSWGLSRGRNKHQISGFVSADGKTCICCENPCNI